MPFLGFWRDSSRSCSSMPWKEASISSKKSSLSTRGLNLLLGDFMVGIIALAFPQILSNGYGPLGKALTGEMVLWLMFILVFMKILATALTLGSGGSGGIFAPALYIGAMLGRGLRNRHQHPFPLHDR